MSTLFMNAHFISATHCAMHIPKNILLSIDFIFNNTGIHFLISNRNSFIGTGNTTATIQRLFKTHHIMQITAYIHVHIQHTVMDLKKNRSQIYRHLHKNFKVAPAFGGLLQMTEQFIMIPEMTVFKLKYLVWVACC